MQSLLFEQTLLFSVVHLLLRIQSTLAAIQSRRPYLAFVHISSTIMSEAEGGCCG